MENISQDYNENLTEYTSNPFEENITTETNFFNSSLHENESTSALLTHSSTPNFRSTPHMISHPSNILFMCQKISDSIKEFKKNAKRQLEQADELKNQFNKLKQSLITQQQSPNSRHVNQNRRVHRSHPYPLVSSHTPSIRPSVSATTYYHDNNKLGYSSHSQKVSVPVATGLPDNEYFSGNSRSSEFYNGTYGGNATYDIRESDF
ncbi:hypothetical protein C1645_815979 [Glomus cerebriforme]|uniref:Uncharacterized protein n=1 Tax=Glomus cerebriforme TaxID=658196 RepID=A0A397THR1_9GLOM|nr:hypothetical protein C1645_815979 [Glomus cerebriforme]